jgi:hypothetical protein
VDGRIIEALILLAVASLAGLTTLIKRDLTANTKISIQARDLSNGQLSNTLAQLAAVRNQVVGLRAIVHERDDRIAYLVARLPEAESLMRNYRNQRESRATAAEELAAERNVLTSD